MIGSKSELFPGLFLMARSDYHTALSIYYYIVTGYEPIGFRPLPDQKPIARILRVGWRGVECLASYGQNYSTPRADFSSARQTADAASMPEDKAEDDGQKR